jgi:hypothetical protein
MTAFKATHHCGPGSRLSLLGLPFAANFPTQIFHACEDT